MEDLEAVLKSLKNDLESRDQEILNRRKGPLVKNLMDEISAVKKVKIPKTDEYSEIMTFTYNQIFLLISNVLQIMKKASYGKVGGNLNLELNEISKNVLNIKKVLGNKNIYLKPEDKKEFNQLFKAFTKLKTSSEQQLKLKKTNK